EDFTKDVTVTSTLNPENSTVITPTGTLSIDGLQELTSVPADAVDLDPELDEDGEVLDFAAAQGEVLRAVDLSFTPVDEDAPGGGDGLPATDLSVRAGGSQTHLAEIDGKYTDRILLSVPEDGSAVLVVSSEGHDQLVDLLTGERQGDDVAASTTGRTACRNRTTPSRSRWIRSRCCTAGRRITRSKPPSPSRPRRSRSRPGRRTPAGPSPAGPGW